MQGWQVPKKMSLADDVREIKEDVRAIRASLYGNGRQGGLFERVALLEHTNRLWRYGAAVLIGVFSSVAASIVLKLLVP
mgnify:CR=1 FL=1